MRKRRLIPSISLIVITAIIVVVCVSSVFAKQRSWKQASERGGLDKDFIYFDETAHCLQGPLIRNNQQRVVGVVLYCDTRSLIVFSCIDHAIGHYVYF